MPLPIALSTAALAPLALRAAPLIAAAALGAAIGRRGPERLDPRGEEALDDIPEGSDLRVDPRSGRADAEARWRRVLRIGRDGPGLSVELAMLGRLRVRREPAATRRR